MDPSSPLLEVRGLRVSFFVDGAELKAVDGVDLEIDAGQTLALVGESGCGKSVTALALLGLIDSPGRIVGGSVCFAGQELVGASEETLVGLRGNNIAMVFQEPMSALNPVLRVGDQVAEAMRVHRGLSRAAAREPAIALLAEVGIPSPAERYDVYPHQLSGGMRQRVMIAAALACEPRLIVADEPTTALDVTIQAQILELLRQLQRDRGMAILFITHDLGLLRRIADNVAVMYAGRIVEHRDTSSFLETPRHPYSRALLESVPAGQVGHRLRSIPGTVPDLANLPAGCAFFARCGRAEERCSQQRPPLLNQAACFIPFEEPLRLASDASDA